jgi:hypothetical protein
MKTIPAKLIEATEHLHAPEDDDLDFLNPSAVALELDGVRRRPVLSVGSGRLALVGRGGHQAAVIGARSKPSAGRPGGTSADGP